MNKKKYENKTLIAQYQDLSDFKDCRFTEDVYKLKDGSKILEFDGNRLSIYSIYAGFNNNIKRKGFYKITDKDYELWKITRSKSKEGNFVDWEKDFKEQFNERKNEINFMIPYDSRYDDLIDIDEIQEIELPF